MAETQVKAPVYELAFAVHVEGDNLFSAKMLKIKDGKVAEWKRGNGTTLGHATAIADSLLSGYAVCAHEVTPQQYFNDVQVI